MVCYILRPLERILKSCLWVCIVICIICLCKVITPFHNFFWVGHMTSKNADFIYFDSLLLNMIWNQQLGQMAQQKKTSTFDKVERFSKHNLLLLQGIVPSLCVYLFNVTHTSKQIPFNRDEQNRRFCWPTSQLILMLDILIGGRFCAFTCPTWNFLIWKQQNLHIKENDQHLVQLLPNKLVTPFITVLLVSIKRLWF